MDDRKHRPGQRKGTAPAAEFDDGGLASRAVDSLLASKGGSLHESVDAMVVPGRAGKAQDGKIPTVRAVPKAVVEPNDIRDCWALVLEAAKKGKPWALRMIIEKHPLAKKYAQLERQLAGLDGDAIAAIAADAGALPQLTEGE